MGKAQEPRILFLSKDSWSVPQEWGNDSPGGACVAVGERQRGEASRGLRIGEEEREHLLPAQPPKAPTASPLIPLPKGVNNSVLTSCLWCFGACLNH